MKPRILAAIAVLCCSASPVQSVQSREPDLLCYYTTAAGRTIDLGEICSRTTAAKGTPATSAPTPAKAQPTATHPAPQSSRTNPLNLSGTWLSKLTSGGQFMMGIQMRFTEKQGRLKVEYLGTEKTKYLKTVSGQRTGQRVVIQDGNTRMVGTLSRDGNRIQFPPDRNKMVVTMYRLGSPGCEDTGDLQRNFQSCNP